LGDDYDLHLATTGADYKTGYGYPYDTVPVNDENRFYVHSWWDNRPEKDCEDCRCSGCCTWTTTASATNLYTGMVAQTPGGVLDFESYYPNSSTTDDRDYSVSVSVSLGSVIGFGIGFSSDGDDVTYDPNDKLTYDIGLVNKDDLPAPTSEDQGVGFETDLVGDDYGYSEDTVDVEVYTQFDYRMGCSTLNYASTDELRYTVTMDLG
jgi:hypothetical protein